MLLSGGYYCECDSGFELDRRNENKCVDVNECRKGLCANGICRNKAGSFEFSRIFQPIFLTTKTNDNYLAHVIDTTKFMNSESPIFCLLAWSTVGRDTLQFINWNHATFSNSF